MLEGWQRKTLNELAVVERGRFSARPRNDPQYYGGSTPFIQTGDVASANGLLRSWTQTLNAKGVAVSKVFPRGTIFVTIAANIGNTAISAFDAACPDSVVAVQSRPGVDRDWLHQTLRFKKTLLESYATKNAQKNINLEILKPLIFDAPPLAEQRRISILLHAWDDAIDKINNLIALKESQRNYFHRKLVSPTRWPICQIGEIISPVLRPEPTPKNAYTAVSIRSHGKGTFQRTVKRPEEIGMDTVYAVGSRDLIVNITFAWEGAIALAKPEDTGCFVSHRFPTFKIDESKIDREFLGYAVKTSRFFHCLGAASPGGAGRNRVLNKGEFLKIPIPLPPLQAQKDISEFLGAADREIALLNCSRDALEKQKLGLMNKLLTGKWRVPAREPELLTAVSSAAKGVVQ